MTGGGWITTTLGAKGTFGVGGGSRQGVLSGHLEYHDHGTGMNVHGTQVLNYIYTGPTSREIQGTAEINGQGSFSYIVDVADNGEPGRNDFFKITIVETGYTAEGFLQGGNIQLHTKCCGGN